MDKITESPFHIGDIVQLKNASQAYGEEFPKMVILEVVKERIDGKPRYKCYCIWFIRSHKEWEFKHGWLTSATLDLVAKKDGKIEPKIGDTVFLLNIYHELKEKNNKEEGKTPQKSEIQPEASADTDKTKEKDKKEPTRFCPPLLTIIGFENPKNQAPIFDNNAEVIREVPSLLVKCLYFNPISNKYSEILLPKEVLIES